MYKGCTSCPYSGHIGLKECPDAYTPVSSKCGLYGRSNIMFIVYVDLDENGEACKPYTGREYHDRKDAEQELRDALNDPQYYAAWIEEV